MPDFRVIVTGSREDSVDPMPIQQELNALHAQYASRLFVKVGDCPTGVDAITRAWCRERDVLCEVFVADWNRHGFKAGTIRNGYMVRSGGDLCLAFNAGARPFRKTGTCDCSCQAADAGIPVRVVPAKENGP